MQTNSKAAEKLFLICTISNDILQYEAMKASFVAAGFDADNCSFRLFDNSNSNRYDPYEILGTVIAEAVEPYIIFCHQDVLLDQNHGIEKITQIIQELNLRDPSWAVLGNAGVTEDHELLRRINDPLRNDCIADNLTPERVYTLDENFLVIKASSKIRCSPGLGGFHLYATDLCLQAVHQGYSCYVISFHLTHLSLGKMDTSLDIARRKFQKQWSSRYKFRYVQTPCTTIFLSRNNILKWLFSFHRVAHWIFSNPQRHKFVCSYSDKVYAVPKRTGD